MSNIDNPVRFTKGDDGRDVADLGDITSLRVVLEFVQAKTKGMFGGLRDKFDKVDPDLTAVAYVRRMAVEACDPKGSGSAVSGAVVHQGDAAGSGAEVMTFQLKQIAEVDSDLTHFAIFAVCADGFERIDHAVARIFDDSGTAPRHIGNVRFDITSRQSAALLGFLVKGSAGWQFVLDPQYGHGATWREFARVATSRLPQPA